MGIDQQICHTEESIAKSVITFAFGKAVHAKGPTALYLPHLTMGNRARGKAIKMTFETKLPLNLEADFNHIAPNRKANNLTLNYVNLYELMARKGWTETTERDEAALLALNDAVHKYHCALGAMLISLHIHYDRVC